MKNLPNLITVIRILLIPLFIILLLNHHTLYGFFVFIFAGITDALDGLIARKWNLKTQLGAYLDPIADKLLLVSSFITLTLLNLIPMWLMIIVLGRDVFIGLTGLILLKFIDLRSYNVKPSLLGKATTWLQLIIIALALMGKIEPLFSIILWSTAFATVASGLHYIYRESRIFRA